MVQLFFVQTQLAPRRRGRPPKSTGGYSETRDALVRAGVAALTEKGFSATGIEEILHRLNVPKGSFYHYFGSKEAYGSELIGSYAAYFARRLDAVFLDESRTPLARLRDFTIDADAGMARFGYTRGCLIGNLGQEMNALPESFRKQLVDVFSDWQRRTVECLRCAIAAGQIAPTHDCDQLAAFFWIGWEGAVLRAKLERSGEPLRTFAAGFFSLLQR